MKAAIMNKYLDEGRSNARNAILNQHFAAIREKLETEFRKYTENLHVCIGDLVGEAYSYAARALLQKKGEISRADVENAVAAKARLLIKDAIRGAKRKHGRKSVKPVLSFDAEPEEGEFRRSMDEKVSFRTYRENCQNWRNEAMYIALETTIESLWKRDGTSPRDREIFECRFFKRVKGRDLAARFGMTEKEISDVLNNEKRRILAAAAEVRERYELLIAG